MVVVKIGDGLGNQLYNYVCGYAVAKTRKEELVMDTSECDNSDYRDYMLDYFKLDTCGRESFPNKTIWQKIYKRVRRNIKYRVIKENPRTYSVFDERVFCKPFLRSQYLYGYWQNIRYFQLVEKDIRRQFVPNYEQNEIVKRIISQMQEEESCAIHLRGQDIAMPDVDYFKQAISFIEEKYPSSIYYVFTNDREQAESRLKHLKIDYRLVSNLGDFSDIDEFFMISSCKNQIISNSTFSRWAAILNNNSKKIVIAPTHGEKNDEEYPSDWIKI